MLEEAAEAGTSLILTYVWALELAADREELASYLAPFTSRGLPVAFVELRADLTTRLERNRTEHRLLEKKSKRNLEWSDANVRELESYTMTTQPGVTLPADHLLAQHPVLSLDTVDRSVAEVADEVLRWLGR